MPKFRLGSKTGASKSCDFEPSENRRSLAAGGVGLQRHSCYDTRKPDVVHWKMKVGQSVRGSNVTSV